jgi:hypothetical protein
MLHPSSFGSFACSDSEQDLSSQTGGDQSKTFRITSAILRRVMGFKTNARIPISLALSLVARGVGPVGAELHEDLVQLRRVTRDGPGLRGDIRPDLKGP